MLDLNEEIDLETAAKISGLAPNTLRSYVYAERIPSTQRPRILRRPNQARSAQVGESYAPQRFITYGALLDHMRKRGSKPHTIKAKPLPDIFFETYGALAEDLRTRRKPPPPEDPLRDEVRLALGRAVLGDEVLVPVDGQERRPNAVQSRLRQEADELGLRVRMEAVGERDHVNKRGRMVLEPTHIRVRLLTPR